MNAMLRRDLESRPFYVWLNADTVNRDDVGGKAANLNRLAALGAPVPAAAALTTAAYGAFAQALALPRRATDVAMADLARIREAIVTTPLPGSLAEAVSTLHNAFMARSGTGVALAVRSSATAEDSDAFSFAGLHDTVLDVRTPEALEGAVRRIWASLWSERAVTYRLAAGLDTEDATIGVVVQQLVRSDVSFIAFATDPVRGDAGNVVITASWGLGETVVSGRVVPDHILVGPDGRVRDYVVGSKQIMTIAGDQPSGGTREVPVPRSLREIPVLSPKQAGSIAAMARDLSRRLSYTADLEGGIYRNAIHLFQVRPVTTLPVPATERAETVRA